MELITTDADFISLATKANKAQIIYADTETTGLDPYTSRLLLFQMNFGDTTYVVDFTRVTVRLLARLRPAFQKALWVFHNATFDWKVLFHFSRIEIKHVYCTMVAEQVIQAGLFTGAFASLKAVAYRRLNVTLDKEVRDTFIDFSGDLLPEEAYEYAGTDVDVLVPIYAQQQKDIADKQLERVMELEGALLPTTARMEYDGLAIDVACLQRAVEPFKQLALRSKQSLQMYVLGTGVARDILITSEGITAINVASPLQMGQFARAIGIDAKSMNIKDLAEWDAEHGGEGLEDPDEGDDEDSLVLGFHHPFLQRNAVRSATDKLLNTYVLGMLSRINPVTKRLHTTLKQTGAVATGRYSSVNPNLQNLPNLGKLAALGMADYDIRSAIIPSEGRKLIISDFSGIEAVILGSMSGDETMLEALATGDIHSLLATRLFGVTVSKKLAKDNLDIKVLRDTAKTITYAIMYGTSGWNLWRSLSRQLASVGITMTQEDGDRYIREWHALFPKAGAVLTRNAKQATARLYVATELGRRRQWSPDYLYENKKRFYAAQREGSNAPIQGGSADMTKLALYMLTNESNLSWYSEYERKFPALDKNRASVVLCVHDEIVVDADEDYAEEAARIIQECMQEAGYILYPSARPYGLIIAEPKISDKYDK